MPVSSVLELLDNMTQWILGNQDDKKTLDNIEASWPK